MQTLVVLKDGRRLMIDEVTQVVVYSDQGDPVSLSYTFGGDNNIITGHFAESGWSQLLKDAGVYAPRQTRIIGS